MKGKRATLMSQGNQPDTTTVERLIKALAEQLKSPLLHIAAEAQAGRPDSLLAMRTSADRALHLIDSYLLCTGQQRLNLEPVSVSSVLYDVAQALDPLARQYHADIEITIAGKYGPVMAHQPSLKAALVTVGHSLLEADTTPHPRLILSAYKGRQGIAAGVFGNHHELTAENFRRALQLFGQARQPLPAASSLNAAGLYVAEALLESMDSRLQVTRRHNLTGLAASLMPSAQLQLV